MNNKTYNYQLLSNAIRMLTIDAIEKSNSGHPGMPMGMADIATVLWTTHIKHNPTNPKWQNRDRFILSNGHGSMLHYSLLHLTGYNVSIEDIKQFRQLGSKTPGHPEFGYTDGIETTTGPLGQGLANAVGMAIAEKLLAYEFNRPNYKLIDHYTYVFVGDGCLMEGVSYETSSLAGTLNLNKLIVIYDANNISIDGNINNWFTENVNMRFKACNWNVIDKVDGHDYQQINNAITLAKQNINGPTIIICKTNIGQGSPNKVGSEASHGAPLGANETKLVRKLLQWDYPEFTIPTSVYQQFDFKTEGAKLNTDWNAMFDNYTQEYPDLASEFLRRVEHQLPKNWNEIISQAIDLCDNKSENIATRKASQNAINYYANYMPELFGGSADLTHSNLTNWSNAIPIDNGLTKFGNYISYGVREFGMSSILNGIYLYGGFKPFAGTFLTFSDYARNAIRMASLMKIAPIFVYTHDSIGLGEDGPTHQPIEHIASLRLIPNLHVWRPCDTVETAAAWGHALAQNTTPSCLILSRQNLPHIPRKPSSKKNIIRGGYIVKCSSESPEILLLATGSEVHLASKIYDILLSEGKRVRLVSMPSTDIFDQQDDDYKKSVLRDDIKYKIAIEAGVANTWYKYIGHNNLIISIDQFGESAKAEDLFEHFGFTVAQIITKINNFILQ